MGKFINGIHGPIQGKVGTIVGATWNGLHYVRSRPHRQGRARSEIVKYNQSNFARLHYLMKPVIDFLQTGFKGYAPRVHGLNAAKSYNLKHAFVGNVGEKVFDPALVRFSYGDLPLPSNAAVTKTDEYAVQFTWNVAAGDNGKDQTLLMAYDFINKRFRWERFGAFRSAGSDILTLYNEPDRTWHIYLAFVAHDRSRQSNSMYLGVVTT